MLVHCFSDKSGVSSMVVYWVFAPYTGRGDILGRCVIRMLWVVMLKLVEYISYVSWYGNVAGAFLVIPFEHHA
jgi:hypothetical protein